MEARQGQGRRLLKKNPPPRPAGLFRSAGFASSRRRRRSEQISPSDHRDGRFCFGARAGQGPVWYDAAGDAQGQRPVVRVQDYSEAQALDAVGGGGRPQGDRYHEAARPPFDREAAWRLRGRQGEFFLVFLLSLRPGPTGAAVRPLKVSDSKLVFSLFRSHALRSLSTKLPFPFSLFTKGGPSHRRALRRR